MISCYHKPMRPLIFGAAAGLACVVSCVPAVSAPATVHAANVRDAADVCGDDERCPVYVEETLDALALEAECLAAATRRETCEAPRE